MAKPLHGKFTKNLNELIMALRRETAVINFLENDFGFSIIRDTFTRKPVHTEFKKMEKVKALYKLYKRVPDPKLRDRNDFKDIAELIKKLPWFVNLGKQYGDEAARELALMT